MTRRTPDEARDVRTQLRREARIIAVILPTSIPAILVVDRLGFLLKDTPVLESIGLLILTTALLPLTTVLLHPWRGGYRLRIRGALVDTFGSVMVVNTGWGSVLAIVLVAATAIEVTSFGSRAARSRIFSIPLCTLVVQIAIASAIVPSSVETPQVHGLATLTVFVGVLAVAMIERAARLREIAHRTMLDGEERFRSLVQNVGDLILVVKDDLQITYASPAARKVAGREPEELVSKSALHFIHPDDAARTADALLETLVADGQSTTALLRGSHGDGSWRWMEVVATNLLSDPAVQGIVVNLRDVTTRHELEEQLADFAFYDSLTKIPNRRWFLDRLEQALARAIRHGAQIAVLFVDLDGFKQVNDLYGHDVGDELLLRAAERLKFCIRREDSVARLGGDEFTLLLEDLHYPTETMIVARRVMDAFKVPFVLSGRELVITASIGISSLDRDSPQSSEELVRQADVAMYVAKSKGKARYDFYEGPVSSKSSEGVR